jgi:hypothetical protein
MGEKITSKEWNALLLSVQGLSDLQAYKTLFPNATEKTAAAAACRYFKRVRGKLNHDDELSLFNLGRGRVYQELNKRLEAECGTGDEHYPDNSTRMRATELLAKINGMGNTKEIARQEMERIEQEQQLAGLREAIITGLGYSTGNK